MTDTVSPPQRNDVTDRQKEAAADIMRAAEIVTTRSQTIAAENKAQTEASKAGIRQTKHGLTHISTMTRDMIIILLAKSTGKKSIASLRKRREGAVTFINKTEKIEIIQIEALTPVKKLHHKVIEAEFARYAEERRWVLKRISTQGSNKYLNEQLRKGYPSLKIKSVERIISLNNHIDNSFYNHDRWGEIFQNKCQLIEAVSNQNNSFRE